jgi:lysophospholipase L1-like esterase
MGSFLLKIIGVLLSLLVAFAIGEGAVRLFRPQEVGPVRFACDPDLGEIPVPGQHGRRHFPGVFDFAYSNNSLGWRGSREYREDRQVKYRVLFLGDSFTYGIGVNDDQTFAAQVEKLLTADNLSVEVMNAGCPGKGTDYEVKLFDKVGRKFHPDLTVLCFFCNDFQDNERAQYYNIDKRGELQAKALNCSQGGLKNALFRLPGYNWLISWSQAANLVKQAGVDLLVNRAGETGPDIAAGLVVSYKKGAEGYANRTNKGLTNLYVERLNIAVKSAGGSLIMFYIPVSQEVREYQKSRTISADEQACVRIAADNGITLWSLTPLLALSGQSIDHLHYQEGHWTAAAHEMAARYMSRCIARRLTERRQVRQPEPIN